MSLWGFLSLFVFLNGVRLAFYQNVGYQALALASYVVGLAGLYVEWAA